MIINVMLASAANWSFLHKPNWNHNSVLNIMIQITIYFGKQLVTV